MLSLASELKPFSEGYNAAAWIKRSDNANAFFIGSRDAQTSAVAGYLKKPIYYLECECIGTFIVWNDKRSSPLSPVEFGRRLSKAVALAAGRPAILISSRPLQPQDLESGAGSLSITLLSSFTDAVVDENFWIYRVEARDEAWRINLLLRVQRPTSIECKACLGLLQSAPAAFEGVGGLCRYHAHCGRSGLLLRRRHRQRRNSLLHFRYVGQLVRVRLIGSRTGHGVALRCKVYFGRQNRSRGRRMRSAFQGSRIG